jgi:uncharacterized protein
MKKCFCFIFWMIVPLTSFATTIDPGTIHFFNSIIQNHVGEVDLFLEGDNSPDLRDRQGNPAIVVAATYKRLRVIRVLLEWQANPNLMSANGMTALMVAASRKNQAIMRLLLQHRANVNLQNPYNGNTALMYVVEKNYANGVQLLVDYRANVNLKNAQGETALTIAQARGYEQIVDILLAGPRRTNTGSGGTQRTDARSSTAPSQSSSTSIHTEAYLSQADALVNQGYLPTAFEVLKQGHRAIGQLVLLQKWFELAERLFNPLKIRQQNYTFSHPQPESAFNKSWFPWINRQDHVQYEKEHPIPVLLLSEVDQIIENYEQLKLSLIDLGTALEAHQNNIFSEEELSQTEELFRKYQIMIEDVKRTRYDYLSFDVFSPYVGRTEQLIFLAETVNFFSSSYSPRILAQAIKQLVPCAHQDLIIEADPNVWAQFLKTYQILITIVGSGFQQAETLKNLAQTLAEKQSLGPEKWW